MSDDLEDTFTTHLSDGFEENGDKTIVKSCINGIVKALEDKLEEKPLSATLSIRIPHKICTNGATLGSNKFCSPSWEYSSDDDSDALFSPLFPPRARGMSISCESESNTNQQLHLINEEFAFPSNNGFKEEEDDGAIILELPQDKCNEKASCLPPIGIETSAVDLTDDIKNGFRSSNETVSSEANHPTSPGGVQSPDHRQLANAINEVGESALCIASYHCFLEGIRILITNGADISITDAQKCSPLHLVCLGGCEKVQKTHDCLDLLLHFNADPNAINDIGKTPLHLAAASGDFLCVISLMQYGAKTAIKDFGGNTPLHYATRGNHHSCMQILLGEDSELHHPTHAITPSFESSWHCQPATTSQSAVDLPAGGQSDKKCDDLDVDTAIMYNTRGEWVQCNESGSTYYYNTVTNESSWEDPSATGEKFHQIGQGEVEVERRNESQLGEDTALVVGGAESITTDRNLEIWSTFFENALSRQPESLVMKCDEANFETKKRKKRTRKKSYTIGSINGSQSIDDLNLSESDVVHYAARTDDGQALTMLIENGFDVFSADVHGNTPLHVASMYGCEAAIKVLLNTNTCDLSAVNYRGESPTYLAHSHGHGSCATLLTVYEDSQSAKADIGNNVEDAANSSSTAWSFLGSWLSKAGNISSSLPPPPPPIDIPAYCDGESFDDLSEAPEELKRDVLEDRKKIVSP
uniref:WW domain-containing protein n=1 Tax=Leptocylindrus danicus TaxID=163516 RepID=A0A7S2LPX7_9STRA|mmetsp:Transcript_826/g.1156  ORF Transcript_826/g.1156 Transcript_826/m.1156 type:complete len:697 (+) Transcript_826:1660-3750(+)